MARNLSVEEKKSRYEEKSTIEESFKVNQMMEWRLLKMTTIYFIVAILKTVLFLIAQFLCFTLKTRKW